jgi:hypothetical protein
VSIVFGGAALDVSDLVGKAKVLLIQPSFA